MTEPIVYTEKDMEYQEAKIRFLEEENKKLKSLKICGKTVEERIEIDKGVVRDDD